MHLSVKIVVFCYLPLVSKSPRLLFQSTSFFSCVLELYLEIKLQINCFGGRYSISIKQTPNIKRTSVKSREQTTVKSQNGDWLI